MGLVVMFIIGFFVLFDPEETYRVLMLKKIRFASREVKENVLCGAGTVLILYSLVKGVIWLSHIMPKNF